MDGDGHDCPACDRPNNATSSMVECEKCEAWFHFDCANVTLSVEDRPWACRECLVAQLVEAEKPQKTKSKRGGKGNTEKGSRSGIKSGDPSLKSIPEDKQVGDSNNKVDKGSQGQTDDNVGSTKVNPTVSGSSSSILSVSSKTRSSLAKTSSSRARRAMELLEQQRKLAMLKLEEEERRKKEESEMRLKRLQIEQDFLDKKNKLQSEVEDSVCDSVSVSTRRTTTMSRTKRWIDEQNATPVKKDHLPTPLPTPVCTPGATGSQKYSDPLGAPKGDGSLNRQDPFDYNSFGRRTVPSRVSSVRRNDELRGGLPEGLRTIDEANGLGFNGLRPTPEQIAARQIWPKKLPSFSGDPESWPLFISSYENGNRACGFSDTENLIRLQECLTGQARAIVQTRLLDPRCVPSIIETLRQLFGRPELLIRTLLGNLRKVQAPHPENLESLLNFGVAVTQLCDHLEVAQLHAHLTNPVLLEEMVGKLPASLKLEWVRYKRTCQFATVREFGDFMRLLVSEACEVTTMPFGKQSASRFERSSVPKEKGHLHTHVKTSDIVEPSNAAAAAPYKGERRRTPCPACDQDNHRLQNCEKFKSLEVKNRMELVNKAKLCVVCLLDHRSSDCRSKKWCTVDNCNRRHHTLLHFGGPGRDLQAKSNTESRTTSEAGRIVTSECNTHDMEETSVLFRVVPVTIYHGAVKADILAFLDEGSSFTLLDSSVATQLGIQGVHQPLQMKWTGDIVRSESASQRVDVKISARGMGQKLRLRNVHTVCRLNLPPQQLDFADVEQRFDHLAGLPVASYGREEPKLLIGLEHIDLLCPIEFRRGQPGDPIAVRTTLGWTVYGPNTLQSSTGFCNVHECSCGENLNDSLRQYFTLEESGVMNFNEPESDAERLAKEILERTTRRVGDRFETGLLWKTAEFEFPDSYPMAVKRLKSFENRLRRSAVEENVRRQIEEYVEKGYAHKATPDELRKADPRKVWYLPLNFVTNPKKPEKVRLVWDAAAKVDGVSLNSMLLKGPDQLTSLLAVLCQFRERRIAFGGDIKEMFHQLRIRDEDKQAQRFLFRTDPLAKPDVYIMDVATFGAACSPCSAQFVKNRNAEDFVEQFPEAAQAIVGKTYVDDYYDSCDTPEEAANRAQQVKFIHENGGFHIRNWVSNSATVLRMLGETGGNETMEVTVEKETKIDRVLGMHWRSREDVLCFSTAMRDDLVPALFGGVRPTKRKALQCVMSLFDPLGLLAPYLVHGKILLQDLWRSGIQWDEELSDLEYGQWLRWTAILPHIEEVRIPRCYFGDTASGALGTVQLHVFADAGERAYGCVAYFRIVDDNVPRCGLVMAKTKVAPLKPLSMPRLELQAAVLGARMIHTVSTKHSLQVSESFLWLDNKAVLSWIQSDPRNYKSFVAHRIGEIHELVEVKSCRWVPTKDNVADVLTKWSKESDPRNSARWYQGPEFLYLPQEAWPKKDLPKAGTIEELRPRYVLNVHSPYVPLIEAERISSWLILLRTMGRVFQFIDSCRRRIQERVAQRGVRRKKSEKAEEMVPIRQQEYKRAENYLLRMTQSEVYPDEYKALLRNRDTEMSAWVELEKSSPLYKLSPFVDEFGVLRIDGRLANSKHIPFETRFPVILPRSHVVTTRILEFYHEQFGHANKETVVNEIRQRYYIFKLRAAIDRVMRNCQWCQINKCKPVAPRMAPLPVERLTPYVRPFSYVGIDYCGPVEVTVGRHKEKRYIVVFTCLTIRAVHLQVAHNLSTDSCKMAIRRFVRRHGGPAKIFSDNGTNFVGASNELKEQIRRINEKCAETFTDARTEWNFNPPSAPHMGGIWERMVRSVKESMEAFDDGRKLTDEVLLTTLAEAEDTINSRPLTYMPQESADGAALTPNHFLRGCSSEDRQELAEPVNLAEALRSSYSRSQLLAQGLWERWVKEYIPTLHQRSKWFAETKPLEEGDLVYVAEGKRPAWTRGRVEEVIRGSDGRIRQAIVKTASGRIKRPVVKLAVLEVNSKPSE